MSTTMTTNRNLLGLTRYTIRVLVNGVREFESMEMSSKAAAMRRYETALLCWGETPGATIAVVEGSDFVVWTNIE